MRPERSRGARGYRGYAALPDNGFLMAVILIVEDEVFTRQIAEFTIEDLGHGTLTAGDLAGALAHLSKPQHIDALIVDICLGRLALAGYDVANQAIAGLLANVQCTWFAGRFHMIRKVDIIRHKTHKIIKLY